MAMTYAQARKELYKLHGVDGSRRQWQYNPPKSYTADGLPRVEQQFPGSFNVQYGVYPTEREIVDFQKRMGGGPKAPKRRSTAGQGSEFDSVLANANAPSPAGGPQGSAAPKNPYYDLLIEAAAAEDAAVAEANAANEARFNRIDQSNIDLYNRTMGEVDNWGNVQSQLNKEQAAESMANVKAFAADRGLGNSNVIPAAQLRSDRDLALVQQDLSERKSNRRIGYDTSLTNNHNDFIERKYDNAPDPSALSQVYAQLGQAEAYRQGREAMAQQTAATNRRQPGSSNNRIRQLPALGQGGVSPLQAQMMAANIAGGFNGIGYVPFGFSGGGGGSQVRRRTSEEYAQIRANIDARNSESRNNASLHNSGGRPAAQSQAELMRWIYGMGRTETGYTGGKPIPREWR